MLSEPVQRTGSSAATIVAVGAALVLAGLVAWWLLRTTSPTDDPAAAKARAEAPSAATAPPTPDNDNDEGGDNERARSADRSPAARRPATAPASPAPATPPASTAAPTLYVESDIPGAMVFVNRKYLGTTPLVSRDVSPGTHQLNVQVEGREPSVQTIDVQPTGDTRIAVALSAARLDARVAVVHKHGMGSCDGTLIASPTGLRYQTTHDKDGFTLPFAQIETFTVDYLAKQLRVKQRGGRTWNFTTKDDNADPLLVFHREVEAARK